MTVIRAEDLKDKSGASRKIFGAAALLFLIWGVYWLLMLATDTSYHDKIMLLPAESQGNDAKGLAAHMMSLAKAKGIPIEKSGIKVDIGPDANPSCMIVMEASYGRWLLLPRHYHVEVRAPVPVQCQTHFDGKVDPLPD